MSVFKRTNASSAWNNASAWTLVLGSGTYPSISADQAIWDSSILTSVNVSAVAVTIGQIAVQNPSTNTGITVGTGTITLTPTAYGSVGIDMSSGTTTATNLSIAAPLALGSTQEWKVPSGRTLTVSGTISGAFSLTKSDAGTLALSGASTGWTGSNVTIAGGLVTASNNNALGAASNTVTVNSGAALQISVVAPAQTVWSASGSGLSGTSYGAIWTNGAFGATRTITTKANGTVISIRQSIAFTGKIALDAGVTTVTINGENPTAPGSDIYSFTMTSPSDYDGTVTLSSLGLNGSTDSGTKYSIGGAVGASDLKASGGGGLGNDTNAVFIGTTGGIWSTSTSGTFYRNYTFTGRSRQVYNHFKMNGSTGITTFNGTLNLSGSTSTYVQLAGANAIAYIIKLDGTITGDSNLDVGSNGSNGNVDGTLELGSNLVSNGWTSTAGLTVNNIRYGKVLANANPLTFTATSPTVDAVVAGVTARHSSYTNSGTANVTFNNNGGTYDLTMTGPVAGSANWTTTPGTWTISANTLTLGFNFTGSGSFVKTGTGTLVLNGNNTGMTTCTVSAGTLVLNSNGSAGPSAANFVFAATGTTIDSSTGATLTQTGGINLGSGNGGFTWYGSADLSMGSGIVTHGGSRTITFVNGATGVLTFAGPLNSPTATYLWNVGGGIAGAKNVLYIANTNASLATTGQVTAGYLRAGNATSLGSESVVGAVAWTVSSGAAIELINGITVSAKKNFNGVGTGPNTDGALRSVSGVNKWQGQISINTATGARIQVDAGTFTLDNTTYTGIDAPAGTNTTPITFTAQSSATLNQDRILAAGFSTVAIANGSGTVVLSKANLHSGAMTCSAGTTKLTNTAAVGAGAGNNVTVTAGATMESAVKAVFPATLTLGSTSTPATFKISA